MKSLQQTVYFLATIILMAPNLVLARLQPPSDNLGLPGNSTDRLSFVIEDYLTLFLGVVGLIAVAFIIYGGFRYITSAGNEENAEQAKKIITNSIIGLIVIILSYVIVTVVINALANNSV